MRMLAIVAAITVAFLGLTACDGGGIGNPTRPDSVVSTPPSPDPLPTVKFGASWTGLTTRYREGDTIIFNVSLWVTGKRPVFAQPFFVREDGEEYTYQAVYGPFDNRGEGYEFGVAQLVLPGGFEEFAGGHTLRARVDFFADNPGGTVIDSMKIPLDYFVCADYFSCY